MIYYYTALVISYSMDQGSVTTSYIWYDRERHCREVLDAGLADPVYTQLDQVSYVLKPKLRED